MYLGGNRRWVPLSYEEDSKQSCDHHETLIMANFVVSFPGNYHFNLKS